MKLTLKPYQLATVDFGLENDYAIFGLEMGLGKSLCALAVWEKKEPRYAVIVCPAYLVVNWSNEIRKCIGRDVSIRIIKSGDDAKKYKNEQPCDFTILSYALAQKAEYLFDRQPFLILDEAHSLSSMKAQRTQFMHRVIYEYSLPNVYMLTGTPIKNRVQEFYSLLAICHYNPYLAESKFLEQFPDEITFADHFSNRIEYDLDIGFKRVRIVKFEGVQRPDELKAHLKSVYVRYRAKDVLDLEPVIMKDVLISNVDNKKLLAEFEAYISTSDKSVAPQIKAEMALKKVPFTVQYVKGLIEEGLDSIAVYTDHVASAMELGKALGVAPITGQMPASMRAALGDLFQAGKTKILVATMGSFSTGVNLTHCRNMVLNDYSWVPSTIAQTIARIQRIGQAGQCTVHRILGSPTDQYILKILEKKNETIDAVT